MVYTNIRVMPTEDIKVPPIVKELAGKDEGRLGVAAQAYYSLWKIYVCGENGDLKIGFEQWLTQPSHAWLEQQPDIGEPTPLVKIRVVIEKEKQRLLAKGLDPCPDFSLN